MPLKPEVNTSPFGALLIVGGLLAIILGLLVLPIGVMAIYAVAWLAVVVLILAAVFYVGQRLHRRFLGAAGGGR